MMAEFAVVVDILVKPGRFNEFWDILAQNAKDTLMEPGCCRFDICLVNEHDDRFVLYETYLNRAAFESHLASPHYVAFRRMSAPLVQSIDVLTGLVVDIHNDDIAITSAT